MALFFHCGCNVLRVAYNLIVIIDAASVGCISRANSYATIVMNCSAVEFTMTMYGGWQSGNAGWWVGWGS